MSGGSGVSEADKLRGLGFEHVILGADYGCPHCEHVYTFPKQLAEHIRDAHPPAEEA